MTDKKASKLTALQLRYSQSLSEQLAVISAGFLAVCEGLANDNTWQKMHYLVHNIAGSAGTFGYANLSIQAHLLENELVALVQKPRVLSQQELNHLAQLIKNMEQSATEYIPPAQIQEVVVMPQIAEQQYLVIIEDDRLLAQEMAAQLAIYGWQSKVFYTAKEAKIELCTQKPTAVIVDISLPDGLLAGTELIQQIRIEHSDYIAPTIVVSSSWDWNSRLSAVKAGADAYLVKPLDFSLLNETLDNLTKTQDEKPCQVLIVEDDTYLCQHYQTVLEAAGMNVVALEDPELLLAALDDFSPDLVLLDLYLSHCNGIEVAKIIRQDNKFTDLSIVFLSSEGQEHIQLMAMQSGADDFLHKPIEDAVLIKAISMRITRFRALRELTRQDRMTGLLNQIAFHLQLEFEIGRIQRGNFSLSIAVLDIDKFKQINDGYGHPVGDAVIKSLARLLKKRLRRTDVVGRLGGDEFGVIMTDTSPQIAVQVLDELRAEFTKLRHFANQEAFSCTFSCGVAGFTQGASVDSIFKEADNALYLSKKRGRNQVSQYLP